MQSILLLKEIILLMPIRYILHKVMNNKIFSILIYYFIHQLFHYFPHILLRIPQLFHHFNYYQFRFILVIKLIFILLENLPFMIINSNEQLVFLQNVIFHDKHIFISLVIFLRILDIPHF